MKLNCIFEVTSAIRNLEPPISIYPVGQEQTRIGLEASGQYHTLPQSDVQGYFIYTQTISNPDVDGHAQGLGLINLNVADIEGNRIQIAATFTVELSDPSVPFSVKKAQALITSATINGRVSTGQIKITPVEGGRRYSTILLLKKLR